METETIVLVSRDERKEIAETCVFTDATYQGLKVVDVNKAIDVMRKFRKEAGLSDLVEIKQMESMNKKINQGFFNVYDKDFNVIYGIAREIRKKDDYFKFVRLPALEHITLHLDKTDDAKKWMIYRMWRFLKGSPLTGYDEPTHEVYDPVIVAKNNMKEAENFTSSFNFITKTKGQDLVRFARSIGLNYKLQEESNVTIEVLRNILVTEAKENATEFMRKVQSGDKQYKAYIQGALNYHIITQNTEKGYLYHDIFLGMSEGDVLLSLKEKTEVFNGIISEVNNKDTLAQKLSETDSKK